MALSDSLSSAIDLQMTCREIGLAADVQGTPRSQVAADIKEGLALLGALRALRNRSRTSAHDLTVGLRFSPDDLMAEVLIEFTDASGTKADGGFTASHCTTISRALEETMAILDTPVTPDDRNVMPDGYIEVMLQPRAAEPVG